MTTDDIPTIDISLDAATILLIQTRLQDAQAALNEIKQLISGTKSNSTQLNYSDLTNGDKALLQQLNLGLTTEEIGKELNLSPNTIRNKLSALYEKLGARNKTEAINAYNQISLGLQV